MTKCGICSHVYLPIAHTFHCPVCAAISVVVACEKKFYNVQNGREMVVGDTSWRRKLQEIIEVTQ